jgi:hypothetical protein
MSYQDQPGGAYPPPPRPNESQYPPPPDDDDRARAYHQRGPSGGVTLPSISPYDPQYAQPNGYPPDPRAYGRPDPYRDMHPGAYGRDDRMPYPMDYGRAPPQMNFSQSAPRQRTAIACRYCRRRKVRGTFHNSSEQGADQEQHSRRLEVEGKALRRWAEILHRLSRRMLGIHCGM